MKKILYFNSKINKLNELEIRNSDAGQILFVPYSKADRCNKCALYLYKDSCLNTPCNQDDRKDKLTGYYRLFKATPRNEHAMPVPGKLMMVFIMSCLLITGCTINMNVTLEPKNKTPEAASDSTQVKHNWF